MPFNTVPDKTTGDIFTEAMWDTYIKDNINKGLNRPIAETVLSGTTAGITFSGIASDWSHLLLLIEGRGDTAATQTNMQVQFNADATGYDAQSITGSASTASASESLNLTSLVVGTFTGSTATGSRAGFAAVFIPFYARTTFQKSVFGVAGRIEGSTTGTLFVNVRTGHWRNTAAITQIAITPATGNLVAGSGATLYGLGGL